MVPGNSRIDKPKITVGATAEQSHRRGQVVHVTLLALGADQKPRPSPREPACGRRHVAHRLPDLAALDGRAADHAGTAPEPPGPQVIGDLEPNAPRAHEGIPLLL